VDSARGSTRLTTNGINNSSFVLSLPQDLPQDLFRDYPGGCRDRQSIWFNSQEKGNDMTPLEIVASLKSENPELFRNLPDKLAARLIAEALARIRRRIEAVEEGAVKVARLGSFRIRQIDQEKNGQTVRVRRVIFRAADPAGGSSRAEEAAAERPA